MFILNFYLKTTTKKIIINPPHKFYVGDKLRIFYKNGAGTI